MRQPRRKIRPKSPIHDLIGNSNKEVDGDSSDDTISDNSEYSNLVEKKRNIKTAKTTKQKNNVEDSDTSVNSSSVDESRYSVEVKSPRKGRNKKTITNTRRRNKRRKCKPRVVIDIDSSNSEKDDESPIDRNKKKESNELKDIAVAVESNDKEEEKSSLVAGKESDVSENDSDTQSQRSNDSDDDYLSLRFKQQKLMKGKNNEDYNNLGGELEEEEKVKECWSSASPFEMKIVEYFSEPHGCIAKGKESTFAAFICIHCKSPQDRSLALTIMDRTNQHDPSCLNSFLYMGGLRILSTWLEESFTADTEERKEPIINLQDNQSSTTEAQPRKRGRPSLKKPEEKIEYKAVKYFITSTTGCLLLPIIKLLKDINILPDIVFIRKNGINKNIKWLKKKMDLLSKDKVNKSPNAGNYTVNVIKNALEDLESSWRKNIPLAKPENATTKEEYFKIILDKIGEGYNALCKYEEDSTKRPPWFDLIPELKQTHDQSNVEQNPKKPLIQTKSKQKSNPATRKKENERLKKLKAERELKKAVAERKKMRLHKKFQEKVEEDYKTLIKAKQKLSSEEIVPARLATSFINVTTSSPQQLDQEINNSDDQEGEDEEDINGENERRVSWASNC